MLKLAAVAAMIVSVSACLFESHAMIWLVAAVFPGAIAVLLGKRDADVSEPLYREPSTSDQTETAASAAPAIRFGRCAR